MEKVDKGRTTRAAIAAGITAAVLGVSGIVVAAMDDDKPFFVETASGSTGETFVAPPSDEAPLAVEDETTTSAEGSEGSTTTAKPRARSTSSATTTDEPSGPTTAVTEESPEASVVPTSGSDPAPATSTTEDESEPVTSTTTSPAAPSTTTTTTAPAPQEWVEVARFEWDGPQNDLIRQQVTLETGVLRIRTSYVHNRIAEAPEAVWFSDVIADPGLRKECPGPTPEAVVHWANRDPSCDLYEGPWATGQHEVTFGIYDQVWIGQGETWRGPTRRGTHWVVVEELR